VIHAARVGGWTVTDEDDGLVFVSPDADTWVVRELAPSPEQVAEDLEALAPEHFEAKSIPYIAVVGGDAAVARATAARLEEERIPDLEVRMGVLFARAALAYVTAEARAHGWEVHWGADTVRYEHGDKIATVAFDNIDIGRLRKALGLKWINL
jgi:hypothetical protein